MADLFLGRPRSRRYPKFNIRRDIPEEGEIIEEFTFTDVLENQTISIVLKLENDTLTLVDETRVGGDGVAVEGTIDDNSSDDQSDDNSSDDKSDDDSKSEDSDDTSSG